MAHRVAGTSLRHLKSTLGERFLRQGDQGWDQARAAWNLTVDQRPAAIALPATAAEVARLVDAAAASGLRVAPQTTGHNAGPLPPLHEAILLKTTRLGDVAVDPERRLATAGGGAVWLDVAEPASGDGLAPLAGTAPDVGVAGYSLGGGLSWLGRRHGIAANSITSLEVVTADGRVRQIGHDDDPDLFWALRGGGGSFGIVTKMEFRLYPVPDLHAGWLVWPWQQARPVMRAWREWLAGVPEEVTSMLRLLRVPSLPVIPGSLRGRDLVIVEAAMLLGDGAISALLAPLRRLQPEIDTFSRIPPLALSHLHMDPDRPVPALGDCRLLDDLDKETIDAIVATAGPGTNSPLVTIELRHLGGELARPHPEGGAVSSFDAEFMLFGAGIAVDQDAAHTIRSRLETLFRRTAPWDSGRRYSSFVEYGADPRRFHSEATFRRLTEIKARVDPHDIFLANHPIPGRTQPSAGAETPRS